LPASGSGMARDGVRSAQTTWPVNASSSTSSGSCFIERVYERAPCAMLRSVRPLHEAFAGVKKAAVAASIGARDPDQCAITRTISSTLQE
jgi:hypothetical protein